MIITDRNEDRMKKNYFQILCVGHIQISLIRNHLHKLLFLSRLSSYSEMLAGTRRYIRYIRHGANVKSGDVLNFSKGQLAC